MSSLEEKEKVNFLEYLLSSVLRCGTMDLNFLFDFYKAAKRVGVELNLEEIVRKATDQPTGTIDFNILLYYIMLEVFSNLVTELPEELQNVACKHFHPHLNYLDSCFNNDLDNILFSENVTREKAIKALENWARNLT